MNRTTAKRHVERLVRAGRIRREAADVALESLLQSDSALAKLKGTTALARSGRVLRRCRVRTRRSRRVRARCGAAARHLPARRRCRGQPAARDG